MCDLAGLILPRPMLVEAGMRDPIASVECARQVCPVLSGDPARDVELDEFEGRHMVSGRRDYDFLWERVGQPSTSNGN
jgi:hypothetical protein